jgi:hypothetical protein
MRRSTLRAGVVSPVPQCAGWTAFVITPCPQDEQLENMGPLSQVQPVPVHIRNGRVMVPLYAARIEDLSPVNFVVVECHCCPNVDLLSPVSAEPRL